MAKRSKHKRAPSQRGPKEERRIITGDPADALAKLLASNRRLMRTAKRAFDAAHVKGMKSLESGDSQGFNEAIKDEATAIKKLSKVRLFRPK